MIYAFNLTCNRDKELSDLMAETLFKYGKPFVKYLSSKNTDVNPDYVGYGNGSGWPQGMLKVKFLRAMLDEHDVADDDFLLSIDSDVVFTGSELFKYIDPKYGIIGTQHQQPYNTKFGKFGHMSGAMIFLRGDIAKKIAAIPDAEFDRIRFEEFKPYHITENEDVMLSYFAKYVGAECFDIGSVPGLTSGDFEADVTNSHNDTAFNYNNRFSVIKIGLKQSQLKSFYHLNYCPTQFLGEPVSGKWDIAKVLKIKEIEL